MVLKTNFRSFWEWPFYTSFTVVRFQINTCLVLTSVHGWAWEQLPQKCVSVSLFPKQNGSSHHFICFNDLRPSKQFFSHVGSISCLPGLDHYYAADKVSCSRTQHSESTSSESQTSKLATLRSLVYTLPTEPLRSAYRAWKFWHYSLPVHEWIDFCIWVINQDPYRKNMYQTMALILCANCQIIAVILCVDIKLKWLRWRSGFDLITVGISKQRYFQNHFWPS